MGCDENRKSSAESPQPTSWKSGKEVVRGMRLRAICRGSQGTIGRIAWSARTIHRFGFHCQDQPHLGLAIREDIMK